MTDHFCAVDVVCNPCELGTVFSLLLLISSNFLLLLRDCRPYDSLFLSDFCHFRLIRPDNNGHYIIMLLCFLVIIMLLCFLVIAFLITACSCLTLITSADTT